MEVIAAVEAGPRGLYTGSIGAIGANGDAAFNVAIRTLVLTDGRVRLGLGGGIVADSVAAEEWDEALAKAAFLARSSRRVDLIETMHAGPEGIRHRALHMARLAASARRLGMALDTGALDRRLDAAIAALTAPARLRMLLAASGALSVQASPLPAPPTEPVTVALAPLPVTPGDWRLAHKTTDRAFYDDARRASGAFEVVFVRTDGRLTEGSFTSLFVERDGALLTPPARDGLLPGVLRAALIAEGRAFEAPLAPADLAGGFLIGNALRGLLRARLVAAPSPPA
jgi:para-aminobenzoate synthetase/4-amino-4-deoxychorismate lyase